MKGRKTTIGIVCVVSMIAVFGGCGENLPEECDEPTRVEVPSGTYEFNSGWERNEPQGDEPSDAVFPHHGIEQRTLEVDKQAGVVEVRYEKNGKSVVETWTIE